MFLQLESLLAPDEIAQLVEIGRRARFADGRVSNPHSRVKNNEQIDHADPGYAAASRLMAGALQRSEVFAAFASPKIMAPPLLARYAPGMAYGVHTDAAFLPVGQRPLRSDLSCTIFVADPASYEGGELSVRLGDRTVTFKGPAGSAVVYPSTTLHEVLPVTRGERIVGLTFIESMVRDPMLREMLFQLDEVAALEGFTLATANRDRLDWVRTNLRRMWSDPV